MKIIVDSQDFNLLLVLGDLNCDFMRSSNHVKNIKMFMTVLNLCSLWTDYDVVFTYIFETENGGCSSSTVDILTIFLTMNLYTLLLI